MDNNFQPTFSPGPGPSQTPSPAPAADMANQPYSHSATTPLQGNQVIPKDALETQKNRSILWIIVTVVSVLTALTFIGLFIWMYSKWSDADTNVNGQIDRAVAIARSEAIAETEQTFEEREKYPYKMFSGPADLGSLTFEYPKTWSLYEEEDASSGNSEFSAYLNPDKVPPVNSNNPIALRVKIFNEGYDSYIQSYQSKVEDGTMTLTVAPVGGANANIYKGLLENDFQGIAAVLKIRDKTVVIQTDALVFENDFNKVLETVKYNS
ncbi:hypothetical protein IJH19_01305 [Candidatus Saccharibacteria bacterium]|nr:hypothetical protein [Candidatus Saccharibacteria bacterium]